MLAFVHECVCVCVCVCVLLERWEVPYQSYHVSLCEWTWSTRTVCVLSCWCIYFSCGYFNILMCVFCISVFVTRSDWSWRSWSCCWQNTASCDRTGDLVLDYLQKAEDRMWQMTGCDLWVFTQKTLSKKGTCDIVLLCICVAETAWHKHADIHVKCTKL